MRVKKHIRKSKTETKISIAHARSIHGDDYSYKRRKGTRIELSELKENESVCHGGDTWHILMTDNNPTNKKDKNWYAKC